MRFKIDENLHPEVADLLRTHGHDAITVFQQGLRGSEDEYLAHVCRREQRTLMTLDLDFADIRKYPPEETCGIIVLRLGDQSRAAVVRVVSRLIPVLEQEPAAGQLWIVDETSLRVRTRAERR